jgi:UDP-2-acetamido-3-amino-2,3-dideoxy-glucuronate N-acetyltransferase
LISPSASVSSQAVVSESAKVWDLAQVREHASLGDRVIVGRGAYIGIGVTVGAESKIQNYVLVYEPAEIGKGVFLGPGAILTNDRLPRAVTPDLNQKVHSDWHPVGVKIGDGASIGAGAICVAPIRIGKWAMVAAGSVVVRDVQDFSLVAGNPARQIGWVGRSGERLQLQDEESLLWLCPRTGEIYLETGGVGLVLQEDSEA